jgi:hypothetical protein
MKEGARRLRVREQTLRDELRASSMTTWALVWARLAAAAPCSKRSSTASRRSSSENVSR